jgi:hypothetical protein
MSSIRPAKVLATLFQLVGGDLALPVDAGGPGCSCEQCQKAWNQSQNAKRVSPRAQVGMSLRKINPS